MIVRELVEALTALDPTLPVVAEAVDTGELIPIDVVLEAGVAASNVPDGAYAVLRPLEGWTAMIEEQR
jgi:hypothetical protein